MFKNKTTAAIFAVMLVLVFAFITKSLLPEMKPGEDKHSVAVYFSNAAGTRLEPEVYPIEEVDNVKIINRVLAILLGYPQSRNLSRIAPEGLTVVNNVYLVRDEGDSEDLGAVLEIEFSSDYHDMTPSEELIFRSAFVWTMTGLDFVKAVHIYVDGRELLKSTGGTAGILTRENVVINAAISPVKTDTKKVKIYLSDLSSTGLVAEERRIVVDPDQPTEKYVMEQLIKGSQTQELLSIVPPETKIRGEIKTEDGICYVNLSGDFQAKQTGSPGSARLSVYSIVNSLTELPNVKKVQLLIEAEKVEDFRGAVDLSKPLERDESYIME